MANFDTLRATYHARIREIHAARNATNQAAKPCDHNWQKFRQTIIGDNPRFSGEAHFVLKGCAKCKRKHLLELVVSTTAGHTS